MDRETGGAVLDRKRDVLYVGSKTQYKISLGTAIIGASKLCISVLSKRGLTTFVEISKMLRTPVSCSPMSNHLFPNVIDGFHVTANAHNGI